MSNLSIGLVTSPSEESKQLINLLETRNIQVVYHILPEEIETLHIENDSLNVWLLNVDDDHWHDNIDQLLDGSDASIYFNEPGSLEQQSHPEYWCEKLVDRLYELTGLSKEDNKSPEVSIEVEPELSQKDDSLPATDSLTNASVLEVDSVDDLSSSLEELETSSVGIPSNIAADLVSELESISPDLDSSIEDSVTLDEELLSDFNNANEISVAGNASHESNSLAAPIAETSNIAELALEEESIDLDLSDLDEFALEGDNIEQPIAEPEHLILDEQVREELDVDGLDQSFIEKDNKEQTDIEQESLELELIDHVQPESIEHQSLDIDSVAERPLDELTLEIDSSTSLDESTQEKHQNIVSDIEEIDENIDLNDFSLELMEEEVENDKDISSEVNYLINNEEEQNKKTLVDESSNVNDQLESLALESINTKSSADRKAVYIIDEGNDGTEQIAQEDQVSSIVESVEDNESLSLELIDGGEAPVTGKAQYVIDDEPLESEIVVSDETVHINKELREGNSSEGDDSELSLEAMEEQSANVSIKNDNSLLSDDLQVDAEGINNDSQAIIDNHSDIKNELSLEKTEVNNETQNLSLKEESEELPLIDLSEESITEDSISEVVVNAPKENQMASTTKDSSNDKNVEEILEIPMLEEAATGIDFEEVVEQTLDSVTPCWVIGASLGGPAAVKRFLQNLPADINASFIIAQHIDENFLPVLADILTSNSNFQVQVANGSNSISAGKVYLAPLIGKVIILQDGSMLVDRSQKWSEPYSPCIDDVIDSVSAVYGDQCGAIIFSGMGQDGLRGSEKMRSQGGQIWAQSVDSCANSSMPEAVINAELASVVAAPEVLADRLVSYINNLSEAI